MMHERHHCARRRARLALLIALLAASGCAKSEPAGSSSSTNFVVCEDDGDCAGHAGAVGCDAQGYCVDVDGDRIAATDVPGAGSGGGGTSGAAGTDMNDAGSTGTGGVASTDAGNGTTTEPICDGSQDMRLGISSGGGFVANTYMFTNPYGNRFLFVDGQCRYHASIDYMQGFASGTLSSAEAEQLATDIGWSMLPTWSAYSDVQCPDAGASIITRPSYAATCICGCQDMGPPGLAAAMVKAGEWLGNLYMQGTRSTGAVSAIAGMTPGATGMELAWPLGRPIADIAGLVQDTVLFSGTSGVGFENPVDTSALRDLRSAAVAQMMYAQSIPVLDQGMTYVVFVRDELPDGVDAAIEALRASSTPSF